MRNAGFSLIEIAIVLVIIGFLLGGVLKGQQLIESAKIKSAVNVLNGVSTAVSAYRDLYRSFPGDEGDGKAARGWATAVSGNADGQVGEDRASPFDTGEENINFWRDLRFAGLIKGNPAALGALARPIQDNPFGGDIGVTRGVLVSADGNALPLALCLGNIPGRAALALDNQLDDGVPGTGAVRSSIGIGNVAPDEEAPAATVSYNENVSYTVCKAV